GPDPITPVRMRWANSFDSCSTCSKYQESAAPDAWSHPRYRSRGSRAFHRATSSSVRYQEASSAVECGPIRYVTASISVGTPSSRARAAASLVTWYTASPSLPYTSTPGDPYAAACPQIGATGREAGGTERRHW